MAEISIKTEVSGRVCGIPADVGAAVGDGDDIVFVEAMKMEIPIAASAAGTVKAILVSLEDMITEGQVVAVIET